MDYKKIGDEFYIRLDKGDKLFQSLQDICEAEHILSGRVQGIGACGSATVSFYEPQFKEFRQQQRTGMLEIVSLLGNVARNAEGKPQLHLHVAFSYLDEQGRPGVLAGHLVEAIINYTGEIVMVPAKEIIRLALDKQTEIQVWHFDKGEDHEAT